MVNVPFATLRFASATLAGRVALPSTHVASTQSCTYSHRKKSKDVTSNEGGDQENGLPWPVRPAENVL